MAVHTSLVSIAAVKIDVGSLWEVLADAVRGRAATGIGVAGHTEKLTALVTRKDASDVLFASVGTGDFLTPWLTRLYAETERGEPVLRLKRIVVKHLDFTLASKLEAASVLERNFTNKLRLNLDTLQHDPALTEAGVVLETRVWKVLPLFHGYLFGEEFLIGPWSVGRRGQLHVKTSLSRSTAAKLPNVYGFVQAEFKKK